MKLVSFEESYGGIIFRREGGKIFYLILRYRNGHWGFPKGHWEKGEKNEQTFLRETAEETGLQDIKIIPGFFEKEKYFYIAKGRELKERKESGRGILVLKNVNYFLGETAIKDITLSSEHTDFCWLEFNEASRRVTFKNSREILKKADDFVLSRES